MGALFEFINRLENTNRREAIRRFGNPDGKTVLLHGNLMCRRQFEDLIPLLEEELGVYAVSYDGFDGTGKTQYGSARRQVGSAVWGNRSVAARRCS